MSTDPNTTSPTLSNTAMESIKSILSTSPDPNQLTSTPSKVKLSWLNDTDDNGDVLEIVEESVPERPVKSSWRTSRLRNEEVEELRSKTDEVVNSNTNMGSKPKLTNLSLLSTSVAHATLEKCLLGRSREDIPPPSVPSPSDSTAEHRIDYSKQCKPGHVIDLLELRRLSSRGIPDAPPESKLRTSSSANNVQSSSGLNPHRSHRPLVWRILLGYLPPQTELWNEVLQRDRTLYANFVKEMFCTTCPPPHEVYDEDSLGRAKICEDEYGSRQEFLRGQRVFREDEDQPETPREDVENDNDDNNNNNSSSKNSEQLTPGLLSARMQQEWVRGEDSIFQTPNNESRRSSLGDSDNGDNSQYSRISPLCAMNTPRSRSMKPLSVGTTITEEKSVKSDSLASGALTEGSLGQISDSGEGEVTEKLNALLLPEDNDMEEETPQSKEMTRSISITTTDSGKEEAVELCRQNSHDNNNNGTVPTVSLSPSQDLDEEENLLLLDEIRKDVIRTHPDLRFFLEPNEDLGQKRYAALERILFVWAKLNKGVRYVQGMNEIVGTLYFVLAHDSNEDWAKEAEADTYFLFNSIMVEMRDVFVPDLDESDSGIHGRISNMITLLALHDPEVRCHLDSVGIDPSFYSVRWLTTLLSREFLLPDTIRLWDSMFASTHKDNFLRYVSVTMVMVMRNQILEGDFSACLRLLQAFPPTNLDRLLESSRALWIYESQITLACHKGGISLGHALRSIAPPPAIIMAYGLHGGIAPPIREKVREAGQRGLKAARGAANGASNASKSFFGSAMGYWRSGSSSSKEKNKS